MTNTRNTPVEALESQIPVRIAALRVRAHSGGGGLYRGGDGLERIIECRAPMRVRLLTERRETEPWGLAGGSAGARGENILRRAGVDIPLRGKTSFDAEAGDILVIRTPGGGGWGPPTAPATEARR
jgi:N-methylhydantoinase B/oxoprolinase/acetone carboxylase alpha subunit